MLDREREREMLDEKWQRQYMAAALAVQCTTGAAVKRARERLHHTEMDHTAVAAAAVAAVLSAKNVRVSRFCLTLMI